MSPSPQGTSKRRVRRTLPRTHSSKPLIGLVNAAILTVGLTVILASRCESETKISGQSGAWLDSLIIPKDLHLPESVTDRQIKRGELKADDDLIENADSRSTDEAP